MRSLINLVTREATGPLAMFERFSAEMLYVIASGDHIDKDRVERFGARLERYFANPFESLTPEKKMTAADIKDHVAGKIKALLQEMGD